jgi:putative SOS response-associated peptidase YedK
MCGRYTIVQDKKDISARFKAQQVNQGYKQHYNAAPSQMLPVITNTAAHTVSLLRWGLVPGWAQDLKIGYKMINARAETLTEKPSFKKLVSRKRCLVIADSFYEWQTTAKSKQPYRIMLKNEELFAFAGLWDEWVDKVTGEIIPTFTIITTAANKLMQDIHDRMPVILHREEEEAWLSNHLKEQEYMQMLRPYESEPMIRYPVSPMVNSPVNDTAAVIEPVA